MNQEKIDILKEQLKNTQTVAEGQLRHFFKWPSLSSFAALQKCLFVYANQHGELVDMSEKPEDLELD